MLVVNRGPFCMDAPILLTQPLVNSVSTRGIGSVLNTTWWSIMQSWELLGEDGQQVVRAGVTPSNGTHTSYDGCDINGSFL